MKTTFLINNIKYRICSICKNEIELNVDNFNRDKTRIPDGFMYNCKGCEKQRTKIKYENNKRKERYGLMSKEEKDNKVKRAKEWRKSHKGRAINLLSAYKKFDKKFNLDFNISVEWMVENIFKSKCCYCNDHESKLGCDRIDNKKGHSIDNVVPCCKECNVARMDNFTHEEMKIIGKTIELVKQTRKNKLA